jgi:hypothetical protein
MARPTSNPHGVGFFVVTYNGLFRHTDAAVTCDKKMRVSFFGGPINTEGRWRVIIPFVAHKSFGR